MMAMAAQNSVFALSKKRWVVLLVLALLSMSNAFLIFTFTAIYAVSQEAFSTNTLGINTLVNTQAFVYLPSSIVGIWISQKLGLRAVLVIAAFLNAACAILHYAMMFLPVTNRYPTLVVGTVLAGFAQPLLFNVPSLVSARWFGAHERDVATAVGALSNPVGNAIASVVPPLVVASAADIQPLMLGRMIVMLLLTLVTVLLAEDKPPSPPSASAAATWASTERAVTGKLTMMGVLITTLTSFRDLLKDASFSRLALGFGLGIGCFNAVMAVIAQLVGPCGYSDDVAGLCGAAMLGSGLLSAAGVGQLLERTRAYVPVLRVWVVLALGATLFMLSSLKPGDEGRLYASFALVGAFLVPLLPIAMETAAEASYPAPEDVSSGALLNVGFVCQIGVLYGITPLLDSAVTQSCSTIGTPSAALIAACIVLGAGLMATVRPDYRRLAVERAGGKSQATIVGAVAHISGLGLSRSLEEPEDAEGEAAARSKPLLED